MKVQINFKEITYGWWEVEVPDNATEDEIYDIAWDKYGESDIEQLCLVIDRNVKRRSLIFRSASVSSHMLTTAIRLNLHLLINY